MAAYDTVQSRQEAAAEADSTSLSIQEMADIGASYSAVQPPDVATSPVLASASDSPEFRNTSIDVPAIRPDNLDPVAWQAWSDALDLQNPVVEEGDKDEEIAQELYAWNNLPPNFRKEASTYRQRQRQTRPKDVAAPPISDHNAESQDFIVDGPPAAMEFSEEREPDYLNMPKDLLSLYFLQGIVQPIIDNRLIEKYKVSARKSHFLSTH